MKKSYLAALACLLIAIAFINLASLRISWEDPLNNYTCSHLAPRVIENPKAIWQLYTAIMKLPPLIPGKKCPIDWGGVLHMDFLIEGIVVKKADIDFEGCGTVSIGKNDVRSYDRDSHFEDMITQAIGMALPHADDGHSCKNKE